MEPDRIWHGRGASWSRSGTRGDEVVVSFNPNSPNADDFADYVVRLLRSLGYRPVLNIGRRESYPYGVSLSGPASRRSWTIGATDYLAAGDFLQAVQVWLARQRDADMRLDESNRAIGRATEAQISQPEHASELWAYADHLVVRLSPHVDFLNQAGIDFLSERVGNNQHSMEWGLLLDQLWVR